MRTLLGIAERLFGANPGPDETALIAVWRSKDAHAAMLETRHAADIEVQPGLERELSSAIGLDNPEAEKITRATLAEVDQRIRERPAAIQVARAREKEARQALADALKPISDKESTVLALAVSQAAQQLLEAAKAWADGRRCHVTILQSVSPATLNGTRPPQAVGFAQPDELGQRLAALVLNPDEGWV